jgi:hypothetical protein
MPCFIYDKHYKVNKGIYKSDVEKIIVQNQIEMRKKWMVNFDHPI